MRSSGFIFFILTLLSVLLPWYYWNGYYFSQLIDVELEFSLTIYLWGVSGTIPSYGSYVDWKGIRPEYLSQVPSSLQQVLSLLIFSLIVVFVGVVSSVFKKAGSIYVETILYVIGSVLCVISVFIFLNWAGGESGQLYGNYSFESTWPWVLVIESNWGPSIGPYLAGFSSLVGFVATYSAWKDRSQFQAVQGQSLNKLHNKN
jgi:hypothetical protein